MHGPLGPRLGEMGAVTTERTATRVVGAIAVAAAPGDTEARMAETVGAARARGAKAAASTSAPFRCAT